MAIKMIVRTSLTDPIQVAWLPLPINGRIGLTFAPGKSDFSMSGELRWERDLELDLLRLRDVFHVGTLVSLLEEHELALLGIEDYEQTAIAVGIDVLHFPILDTYVPRAMPPVSALLKKIEAIATQGRGVVIHCRGGLGRSGVIGGCLLLKHGLLPDEALKVLATVRSPDCPENETQREFIRAFARCMALEKG